MVKKFELRRNIFHIFYGLAYVLLIYFGFFGLTHLLVLFFIGLIVALISTKHKIPFINWWLKHFERPKTFPGKGALTFLVGVILAVWLFPKDVALAAIMILTLGDSISHYFGRFYGRIKHPLNKLRLLEGTVLGIIFSFLGAMLFIPAFPAFIASFIAMIVEAVDMRLMMKNKIFEYVLDDNVVVPLVAGVVLLIL